MALRSGHGSNTKTVVVNSKDASKARVIGDVKQSFIHLKNINVFHVEDLDQNRVIIDISRDDAAAPTHSACATQTAAASLAKYSYE